MPGILARLMSEGGCLDPLTSGRVLVGDEGRAEDSPVVRDWLGELASLLILLLDGAAVGRPGRGQVVDTFLLDALIFIVKVCDGKMEAR